MKELKIKEINNMLYQKTLPLGIAILVLGWLLTPNTYSIISTSNLDLWDFDLLNTMFVLINISIYLMAAVLVVTFIRLLIRRKRLEVYFEQVNYFSLTIVTAYNKKRGADGVKTAVLRKSRARLAFI